MCETSFDEARPIRVMKEIEGEIAIAEEKLVEKEKNGTRRGDK